MSCDYRVRQPLLFIKRNLHLSSLYASLKIIPSSKKVMQSSSFKIGMNETALGTGVPYWIKVKNNCGCIYFQGSLTILSGPDGEDGGTAPGGVGVPAEHSFWSSSRSQGQRQPLNVYNFTGRRKDVLFSYLTGWPSGRIGREQREGSNFLLKDSELGKVLLLTHGLLQINFV